MAKAAKLSSATPTSVLSIDVGIRNLAYCHVVVVAAPAAPAAPAERRRRYDVVAWGAVDISGDAGVMLISPEPPETTKRTKTAERARTPTLARRIVGALGCLPECDLVLIENQPGLKNPLMKSVQACIETFYAIKGTCEYRVCSPQLKTARALEYLSTRDPGAHGFVRSVAWDKRRMQKAFTVAAAAYAVAEFRSPPPPATLFGGEGGVGGGGGAADPLCAGPGRRVRAPGQKG